VAQVAFWAVMAIWAEVPLVLVEVWWLLSASCMSADSLLNHFDMEGSQPYDFCKSLPGIFSSQPSSSDARETQLHVSSVLGLQREDS
jgi:hypothetical protein